MTDTLAPVLGEATIQELRDATRGDVFTAGDDGYEEACGVWNGVHDDRRPALVVRWLHRSFFHSLRMTGEEALHPLMGGLQADVALRMKRLAALKR